MNDSGVWEYDGDVLNKYLSIADKINRPVVIYLMADHFASENPLADYLLKNDANLMKLQDGTVPVEVYWGRKVIPFTLSADESIPVNKFRFEAFKKVAVELEAFDKKHHELIIGFNLGGEIHQMFPGFSDGTGKFDDVKFTDYSDNSIKDFRNYLIVKYKDLSSINKIFGTDFKAYSDIYPPSKDIRKQVLKGYWEHVDSYAYGVLPVFGWINSNTNKVKRIDVYVDGIFTGEALYGINRLDVYQQVESVKDPNVGFRYDLKYGQLGFGIHKVSVVCVLDDGSQFLLSEKNIVVMDKAQSIPVEAPVKKLSDDVKIVVDKFYDLRFWVDSPKELQDLFYNPFAKEWQSFREDQVEKFIVKMYELVAATGFPKERIYSHQFLPYFNGGWNDMLMATAKNFGKDSPYQNGITLYGGSTYGDVVLQNFRDKGYAITEFNPLLFKNRSTALMAIITNIRLGARFIAPYYMSILHREKTNSEHAATMRIEPGNTKNGNNYLYRAILFLAQF